MCLMRLANFLLSELRERQEWVFNIIAYNVSKKGSALFDTLYFNEMLKKKNSFDTLSVVRLGKMSQERKPRPLKVRFFSSRHVNSVLRHSKDFVSKRIKINNDEMKNKREYFTRVRNEFLKRLKKGE